MKNKWISIDEKRIFNTHKLFNMCLSWYRRDPVFKIKSELVINIKYERPYVDFSITIGRYHFSLTIGDERWVCPMCKKYETEVCKSERHREIYYSEDD